MERKQIIIDRSKWKTGVCGIGDTQLLNDNGFKCCLGFITIANKKRAKNLAMPASTNCVIPDLSYKDDTGHIINTKLAYQAAGINDNQSTSLQEKEKALQKLFKKSKYKLKFIGKPVNVV